MLDLNFVRDNLELVKLKMRERGLSDMLLDQFEKTDRERRLLLTTVEALKARRNKASDEIATLKKQKQDAAALIAVMKPLREEIEALDEQARDKDEELRKMLRLVPNVPHASVPVGTTPADNQEVRRWGQPRQFDFEPQAHWDLGPALGILDFERATKITGARFAVYVGVGAKLERALANFMLDVHTREHGYTEILPPFIVNTDSMYGTGQLPKFEEDLFRIYTDSFEQNPYHVPKIGEIVALSMGANPGERFRVKSIPAGSRSANIVLLDSQLNEMPYPKCVPWSTMLFRKDYWLIPTAEVPVTNLYRDEVLEAEKLPVKHCAWTACFRSEAGSYGKDTRGIIRQHQFQKVELVKFTLPENSYDELEGLTHDAEEILQRLELPYRVITLCTGDLGFSSAKTYDLEVWLPAAREYKEISSCSNFEAFQARRANLRFRRGKSGKTEFLHTLNGSGLAVGRTWLAIIENYQQADGSVIVPTALRPYLDGLERITPQNCQ
jgi:seryl-tRNA synthetase